MLVLMETSFISTLRAAETTMMILTSSEMGIRIMALTRIRGQPQAGI